MNNIKKRFVYLWVLVAVVLTGCDDRWDSEDVSGTKSQTLWEVISTRSELSSFKAVLQQTGDDVLLNSSGAFTVLAPTNDAMSAMPDSLRSEVPAAHIALLEYNKAALDTMTYLAMSNGKMVVLSEMALQTTEIVCRNGILRLSGVAIEKRPNIYEKLMSLAPDNDMAAFIVSLGDSVMDMEKSYQTGIDATTGQPIYDTIMTFHNPLFERIPLNDNDSLLSLVLLDNASFATLTAKYWPYLKQHNGENRNVSYITKLKIDSVKTDSVARAELVCDLTCYLTGAVRDSSVYTSTRGIVLNMDGAIDTLIETSNGNIQLATGVNIRLKDNKIKDVIVEGENYYDTNESYVFTRIKPIAHGGKDVVLCGADTMRTYAAFYSYVDTLTGSTVVTDSVIFKTIGSRYGYYGTSFSSNGYPQTNYATGGSYLAYKAPLFSCTYKIYWRSCDDRPTHCQPDTTAVNYAQYRDNANYPCGGVLRNVQKLYLSQPGDYALSYNSDPVAGDFVLNFFPNNPFVSAYKNFGCMAGYDPAADDDEFNATGGFARLGVNAGYGCDDPNFETPLLWCRTAQVDKDTVLYSGITDISTNLDLTFNAKTGKPTKIPRDIFLCLYAGDATVFVTNAPFNQTNKTRPTINSIQPHGSIYLDYIRFVPDIDE